MDELLDAMADVRDSRAARIFVVAVAVLVGLSMLPEGWKLAAARRIVALTHSGCADCEQTKPCVDCDDEALGLTVEQAEVREHVTDVTGLAP